MEARPSEKGVPNTHSTKYLPLRKSYLMWPWCVMITKEMLHADTFPQIAFLDVKIEMILGKCFDDGGLWKSKKETRNMLKNWRWPVSQLELLWHQGQGGSWSQSCLRQWKLLCNYFFKLNNFTLNIICIVHQMQNTFQNYLTRPLHCLVIFPTSCPSIVTT